VGPVIPLTALLMVRDSLGPLAVPFVKWNVEMSTEVRKSFAKEDKEYTSVVQASVRESLASAKAGTRFARADTVHAIHTQTGVPLSLLTIMISWCNTPVESYKGTTVVSTQLREGIGHKERAALAE
jgi:hypothetical protein